jgi:hypothetical protein
MIARVMNAAHIKTANIIADNNSKKPSSMEISHAQIDIDFVLREVFATENSDGFSIFFRQGAKVFVRFFGRSIEQNNSRTLAKNGVEKHLIPFKWYPSMRRLHILSDLHPGKPSVSCDRLHAEYEDS